MEVFHTCYYINLERSKDRRKAMEKRYTNLKRVEGVDGMNLHISKEILSRCKMSLGEIGCLQSHLKAIKTAYDNGDKGALIMEDDMRIDFINKWDKSIYEIVKNKPKDAECIILHCSGRKHILKMLEMNCDYSPWFKGRFSTGCYYITRKGMEKIIKLGVNFIPKSYYPSDHLIYKLMKSYNYTKPLFNTLNIEKSLIVSQPRVLNLIPIFRKYFNKRKLINKLKNDNVNKTKAFLVNLHKLKNEKKIRRKNLIRKKIKAILIKRGNNILRIRNIIK